MNSENTRTKESDKAPREWWTNPTWVGLMATLIAAIAPVTTAIYTSTTSNAQLRLEERKQIHEMRQEYLNRVLTAAHTIKGAANNVSCYALGAATARIEDAAQVGQLEKCLFEELKLETDRAISAIELFLGSN